MHRMNGGRIGWRRWAVIGGLALTLAVPLALELAPEPALALTPGAAMTEAPALVPVAAADGAPPAPWHVVGLPAQRKPFTRFDVVALDGERVLRVEATQSYGNLVHATQIDDGGVHQLSWRWRVDEGLPGADLSRRATEDLPVRVCALFDLPLAAVPFVERQMLRAVRMGTADDPPAASVCYVWDARLPPGSVLASPFTRRVRYLVLHGPETPLHSWRVEKRDLGADFLKLFGDEAKTVPPLIGVAVGADADNTKGHSLAHVADLVLR
jgi:hypothetical protein